MGAVEVHISLVIACNFFKVLVGNDVALVLVGVVSYHAEADSYKSIGVFVDSCGALSEEV